MITLQFQTDASILQLLNVYKWIEAGLDLQSLFGLVKTTVVWWFAALATIEMNYPCCAGTSLPLASMLLYKDE